MAITEAIFDGRLSDGRTAGSRRVNVRLDRAALSIASDNGRPDEEVPENWAYHRLNTNVPIASSTSTLVVTCLDAPGASLLVDDADFTSALARRAPHLSTRTQRWRYVRPALAIAAVVGLVTSAIMLFNLSPARALAGMLPDGLRQTLGAQTMAAIAGDRKTCEAPAARTALNGLTERLLAGTPEHETFQVAIIDLELVNAFAAAGNRIVITRGLIENAQSADEVAGVLAHEIGHGLALHPETALVRTVGIAAAMELLFTGSSGTLGNVGAYLLQLRYTRDAEREADTIALRLLRDAGISPTPLAEFFARMEKSHGDGDDDSSGDDRAVSGLGDLFRTHPRSPERAAQAAKAANYPTRPALKPGEWLALKSACQ